MFTDDECSEGLPVDVVGDVAVTADWSDFIVDTDVEVSAFKLT